MRQKQRQHGHYEELNSQRTKQGGQDKNKSQDMKKEKRKSSYNPPHTQGNNKTKKSEEDNGTG